MFRLHRYGIAPLAFIGLLFFSFLVPAQAIAAEVMVAVASNFTAPMKDISAAQRPSADNGLWFIR